MTDTSLWPDRTPNAQATWGRLGREVFGQARGAASAMPLAQFVREAWATVEPETEYLHNWHVDAICAHLEAVTDGRIRWLLINIPPGHMKALLVSVFWPAWAWTRRPGWRALFGSYETGLAIRDSVRCRTVIDSEWYRDTFRPPWTLSTDQNVKSFFQNTQMGFRLSLAVGSKTTGYRGDCVVVDDPLNVRDRYSQTKRDAAGDWWFRAMSSRLNDQRVGARVMVMQRLHEDDPAGRVIARGGYEQLVLPSEFEPERRAQTSIGWTDPRTEPGELLFPTMFPARVLDEVKADLGSIDYAGQHQQRPASAEGTIFHRAWWRYYDATPPRFHQIVLACDANVKETTAGSYAVVEVWGRVHADLYLLGQIRSRFAFPNLLSALRWASTYEPAFSQRAQAKYVEDKANGPAVIATLKREIPGIIAVPVEADKESRWRAASPYVEAGNVHLPGPGPAAAWTRVLLALTKQDEAWLPLADVDPQWVEKFVDELATVPTATYNDQADTATMAILRLAQPPSSGAPAAPVQPAVSAAAGAIAAME